MVSLVSPLLGFSVTAQYVIAQYLVMVTVTFLRCFSAFKILVVSTLLALVPSSLPCVACWSLTDSRCQHTDGFSLFLPSLRCLLVFTRLTVSTQPALVTPSQHTFLSLICSTLNFTQYYTFHSQLSAFTLDTVIKASLHSFYSYITTD
ncbi:hypothetical protein ATANTOWER_011084 [Ataeniobius toweri]|uniref:Secreted protein n=1 Tax=Ataeniobius toweri TaxID=208326 RepID=A0ABU7BIC2_9TELE|nr:hypothetical protein [Ataeniobius toweri]